MQPTRIGNFEVARVADYEGPFFAPGDFFPDFDPAVVEENAALLGPRLIEPGTGKLIFSFHSFVIKTGRHTILVDACIGNDKERPTRPQFHRMKSPFIEDLARLGVKPEDVDYVMCTHLHWDHVGWNTRLADGQWVPTFPKARYVVAKREYDHWQGVHDSGVDTPHARAFGDSVLPVVKTGQALALRRINAGADGMSIHKEITELFNRRGFPTEVRNGRRVGFFHGTGHGLGLEIHEYPRLQKVTLKAGQCLTVEPGLYYPGWGGIRIEDVVIVRDGGVENLTGAPKRPVI